MRRLIFLWMLLAFSSPASAQISINNLPVGAALGGTEKAPIAQGAGCAAHTTPCNTVSTTPAAIATYVAGSSPITSSFQPLDSDLTAIAATTTTSFGRSLLTQADAAAVRSTLGLVIGTNVQAYNASLGAIAGLTGAADTCFHWTATTTVATHSCPSFGRSILAASSAGTARTTLGLAIGTDVQAYSANLAALGGVTSAADTLPYFTGSGTASTTPLTTAGRALIDDADATAQRTTLGLGSAALSATTDFVAAPPYPAGRFFVPDRAGSSANGTAPGAGSIHMFIGYVRKAITVTQVATRVVTGVAGGNIRFAIYAASATTLMPTGAPIYNSAGDLSAATSSVAAVDTGLSVSLAAGWYWFASNTDTNGGTAVFISIATNGSGQPAIIGGNANNTAYSTTGLSKTSAYGTWPTFTGSYSTDGLGEITAATVPMLWIRN